jgi:flagellar L-ring protein precursor FlgH
MASRNESGAAPVRAVAVAVVVALGGVAAKGQVAAGGSPQAAPLGEVMQETGGSLYQAQSALALPPADTDPATAPKPGTLAAESFFSVKEEEPKTYKKHDLVTVIIKEQSNYSSNGDSDLERQTDEDAKLDQFITLNLDRLRLGGITPGGTTIPEVKSELDRDFKAQATVDRTDSMTERVTAEVVDVKPNGTLVLQAIKDIKTDEEERRFVLTGTCKSDDIAADNTLVSTQLFDINLTETCTGAVRDTTRRGWLPRLLDFMSPF